MSEGVRRCYRGLCTQFPVRSYTGIRGWGNLSYVGIISHPLQSRVPLPFLRHGHLPLLLQPDRRYVECTTFDIHLNQTPTGAHFSPLQFSLSHSKNGALPYILRNGRYNLPETLTGGM